MNERVGVSRLLTATVHLYYSNSHPVQPWNIWDMQYTRTLFKYTRVHKPYVFSVTRKSCQIHLRNNHTRDGSGAVSGVSTGPIPEGEKWQIEYHENKNQIPEDIDLFMELDMFTSSLMILLFLRDD